MKTPIRFARCLVMILASCFVLSEGPLMAESPDSGPSSSTLKPGRPTEKHLLPHEAQHGKEAKVVLAAGAKRLDLPQFQTYAVTWFPENYAKQSHHRVLFTLHGSFGNAYQGIYHQLNEAKQHGYGVIALQWWRGGDEYIEARVVEAALYKAWMEVSRQYPVNPNQVALETFSRSGSISYEIAYWNKQLKHPHYQVIIAQSGGIPQEHPRPLIRDMVAGKLGEAPLAGFRFFMYCGKKDKEWGEAMCRHMHYAQKVVEENGGEVVRFIESENGGHGGMHNIPAFRQAEINTFLSLTP